MIKQNEKVTFRIGGNRRGRAMFADEVTGPERPAEDWVMAVGSKMLALVLTEGGSLTYRDCDGAIAIVKLWPDSLKEPEPMHPEGEEH